MPTDRGVQYDFSIQNICRDEQLYIRLIAQSLHALRNHADKSPGSRLKIPVRFILDDFASNAYIPDFDMIISVIRSREISVSVILQIISQLNALYGDERQRLF